MAKRLFYSCRSPSAAAAVSPTTTLLPTAHPPVVPTPSGGACCPRRVPRRGRGPQTPAACGAGGCAVDYGADDLHPARGTPAYRWLKSSRWHIIEAANAYASDGDGDDTPRLKIDARRRVRHSRRRRRRRVLHRSLAGPASWSSGDSGWFSSDDGDEPFGAAGEASSALHVAAASSTTTAESSSTGASRNSAGAGAARGEEAAAAALAGGFAVVKRSDDPRADFRQSMAEMVVGRGIYDADGLERLLRCFLALNDQRHRRDIVAAFGDVWEAVFSNPPPQSHSHGAAAAAAAAATSSVRAAAMSHP
ncbi:transcription repressor OFP7-like [Miscanthus floridulus]|uniref:transcription repressor OFP7-like n=1 Tax=Miscanthus floridulus TaxID=154761 RepID=UPI00345849B1